MNTFDLRLPELSGLPLAPSYPANEVRVPKLVASIEGALCGFSKAQNEKAPQAVDATLDAIEEAQSIPIDVLGRQDFELNDAADLMAQLFLSFAKFAIEMKKLQSAIRYSESRAQIAELTGASEKMREAAAHNLVASICGASASMASGLAGFVGAVKTAGPLNRAHRARENAALARTKSSEEVAVNQPGKAGEVTPLTGLKTSGSAAAEGGGTPGDQLSLLRTRSNPGSSCEQGKRAGKQPRPAKDEKDEAVAVDYETEAREAMAQVETIRATWNGVGAVLGSSLTVTDAAFKFRAGVETASVSEKEAKAKEHEFLFQQAQEFIQQSQEWLRGVQSGMRSVVEAALSANKSIHQIGV